MARLVHLQTTLTSSSVPDVQRAVVLAEDAGLDGLGVGDHVSFSGGAGGDGLRAAARVVAARRRAPGLGGLATPSTATGTPADCTRKT